MTALRRTGLASVFTFAATLGPIGYIPAAPGTFGTLAALLCHYFFPMPLRTHLLFVVIGYVLGSIAASIAEKELRQKDPGKVVIDEFIGYYAAVFWLPHTTVYIFGAFVLFRLLDIFKPLGIRKVERSFSGGHSIMADDLVAGVYANLALQALRLVLNR